MDRMRRLPAGTQPYDPLNGIRVGALVGGVIAAIVAVAIGFPSFWAALGGAVAGGVLGYRIERARLFGELPAGAGIVPKGTRRRHDRRNGPRRSQAPRNDERR